MSRYDEPTADTLAFDDAIEYDEPTGDELDFEMFDFDFPVVETLEPSLIGAGEVTAEMDVIEVGEAAEIDVAVDFRETGESEFDRTESVVVGEAGAVEITIEELSFNTDHEYRATAVAEDADGEEYRVFGDVLTFTTEGFTVWRDSTTGAFRVEVKRP